MLGVCYQLGASDTRVQVLCPSYICCCTLPDKWLLLSCHSTSCQVPDAGVGTTRLPGGDESAWASLTLPWYVVLLGRLELITLSLTWGIFPPPSTPTPVFLAASHSTFQGSLTLFPPLSRILCPWYLASQARQRRRPHIPYTIFLFSGY